MKPLTQNNKLLKIIAFISASLLCNITMADQTYMLQLDKDITQENKRLEAAVKEVEKIRDSKGGKSFHKQALSLPKNSVDRQYATSKYVNEELKLRIKEYEILSNLGHTNDKLAGLVNKYLSEIKESQKQNQGYNINSLDVKSAKQALNGLKGRTRLIEIILSDPSLTNNYTRGKIISLAKTNDNLNRIVKQQFDSKDKQNHHYLVMEMYNTLKIQRPLIKSSLLLLETKIGRLKGMQLSGNTKRVVETISLSVNQISQITGGKESNARDKRDDDIEAMMQPEWGYEMKAQSESHDDFYSRVAASLNARQ